MIKLLARIGFVRIRNGKVVWPFSVWSYEAWMIFIKHPFDEQFGWGCLFRNRPGVIKRIPGRILPRRWGFRFLGFEFGDRGG